MGENSDTSRELSTMEVGDIVLLGTKNEKFNQERGSVPEVIKGYTKWKLTTSPSIRMLQNVMTISCSKYSHVALCVDDGLFIEAKGEDKVIFSTYADLFKVKSGERYAKHFRYNSLKKNAKSQIRERALYFTGTPYSDLWKQLSDFGTSILNRGKKKRTHTVEDDYSTFCSALVVDMLEGIKIEGQAILSLVFKGKLLSFVTKEQNHKFVKYNSKYVLPSHIEKELKNNSNWVCVDSTYDKISQDTNRQSIYAELGQLNKQIYVAKQKSLQATRSFYTIRDYYETIPLWFRLHIYHLLKQGTRKGEVKEYLVLKRLAELLAKEGGKDGNG